MADTTKNDPPEGTQLWYATISREKGIPVRCPYAALRLCPQFSKSFCDMDRVSEEDKQALNEFWKTSELCPLVGDRNPDKQVPGGVVGYWHFCPEVLGERFGVYSPDLCPFKDEVDEEVEHARLKTLGDSIEPWRWVWAYAKPMHFCDCPSYALISAGNRVAMSTELPERALNEPVQKSNSHEPLTRTEQAIQDLLAEGKPLTCKELTNRLCEKLPEMTPDRDESTVKRALTNLKELGLVANKRGAGYYLIEKTSEK